MREETPTTTGERSGEGGRRDTRDRACLRDEAEEEAHHREEDLRDEAGGDARRCREGRGGRGESQLRGG